MQLCGQQLADAFQPGLSPGELQILFAATLGHRLMGHRIGQWQRLVEPSLGEGESIAVGIELTRAIEALPVAGVVVGCAVDKACTQ